MRSKNDEENGYGIGLNLLIILYKSRISYPRRSECRGKSACFRPPHLSFEPMVVEVYSLAQSPQLFDGNHLTIFQRRLVHFPSSSASNHIFLLQASGDIFVCQCCSVEQCHTPRRQPLLALTHQSRLEFLSLTEIPHCKSR